MDCPEYLILDEPFDALDLNMQDKVVKILNRYLELNKETTIIYTTHNEMYQKKFADEIYEIKDHQIKKVEMK
ncbi:MAG: hypothetical protein LBR15_02470 [Methanobrevibacter sp.]|jgi:ABC-type molybdenum transport system ATPase subunit/photorepair protein PhrA|nr:hypothetical protein [Candidatus Methanovirga australis]